MMIDNQLLAMLEWIKINQGGSILLAFISVSCIIEGLIMLIVKKDKLND